MPKEHQLFSNCNIISTNNVFYTLNVSTKSSLNSVHIFWHSLIKYHFNNTAYQVHYSLSESLLRTWSSKPSKLQNRQSVVTPVTLL